MSGEQQSQQQPQFPRAQKIEHLIKRVVEKESRDRLASRYGAQRVVTNSSTSSNTRLQVCDGIVRSKLPLFDNTKRPARAAAKYDDKGLVKSRLAMFDAASTTTAHAQTASAKTLAERRLKRILSRQDSLSLLPPKEPIEMTKESQ